MARPTENKEDKNPNNKNPTLAKRGILVYNKEVYEDGHAANKEKEECLEKF